MTPTVAAPDERPVDRFEPVAATPRAGDPAAGRAGVPTIVWLLTLLHVVLLLAYTALVPTFRAPDEYVHVDLIRRVAAGDGYPAYDEQRVAAPIFAARDTSPAYLADARAVAAGEAIGRAQRPSFEDLGPDRATDVVNPLPQHPPLYYGMAGGILAALEGLAGADAWPFDLQVAVLRVLSVLLVAPLPLLAWAGARRLGCPRTVAVAAAALVLVTPSLTHIGSAVNNDNLLVLLAAVLTVLVAGVLGGDLRWRTTLGAGLVLGLALLTKGFALTLVPFVVAAYLLAPRPHRGWRAVASRIGAVLVLAAVVGGWWWVRNKVVHGRVQPGVGLREAASDPVEPDVWFYVTRFAGRLFGSFWGTFGWDEARLPGVAVAVATVVLVVGVVAAFAVLPTLRSRARLAVLVLPAAQLLVLVAANAWRAYLKTGTPFASQGRYLFAGLLGLLLVAAIGFTRLADRRRAYLPLAVVVAAVTLHVLAVHAIVVRYWDGRDLVERLDAVLAFSPWPEVVVAAVVVAPAVLAVEIVWRLASAGRGGGEEGRLAEWRQPLLLER